MYDNILICHVGLLVQLLIIFIYVLSLSYLTLFDSNNVFNVFIYMCSVVCIQPFQQCSDKMGEQ
jgi:hypothetical protein